MTGFGRGTASGTDFEVSVDIKTVNNRFLDVVIKLGSELQNLEAPLKKIIGARLSRGRVDVSIQYDRTMEIAYELNRPAITGYLGALKEMQTEFDIAGEPDINVISRLPNVLNVKKEEISEEFLSSIEAALILALNDLRAMRASEGGMLKAELTERLARINECTGAIEREASNISENFTSVLQNVLLN
jgi:uncharacterized protein (TIGR00255 family)